MERTARTAAAERTGSFFMNDMDQFPSLYKYHACGKRQKKLYTKCRPAIQVEHPRDLVRDSGQRS